MIDLAAMFAQVSAGISAQFGGPYFPARIVRYTAPVTDDGGSIVTPAQPTYRACMAQVDVMTEAMRAQDGYADRDVRILILQASLAPIDDDDFSDGATFDDGSGFAEDTKPPLDTDDTVRIDAGPNVGAWSVQSVGADPMAVYFEVRGRARA